jgi:type I restriction enzyme M protein
VIEPYHGQILDPACGSGGMFVQSARFVAEPFLAYADNLELYPKEGQAARHLAPLFGKLCRDFVSWRH